MTARRVLLIVSGGIAAYKSLELVRLLSKAGVGVTCVLTEGGARFVTALSLQALSGERVHTDLWSLTEESEMGHIELSRSADLVVVAPASADILARMAAGLASDLATTLLLATDTKVLVAPAMNVRMWTHPATVGNLAVLAARGVVAVGPDEGAMACNEYGPGRLAEPPAILAAILAQLDALPGGRARTGPARRGEAAAERAPAQGDPDGHGLAGRRALVTAGPTHEAIDPVRYFANRSSGRQGYAIASALAALGARVTLVSGPTSLPDPPGVAVRRVESAREMLAACEAALPADVAVCAAAVGDWRVADVATHKMKKTAGAAPPTLALVANPDILATLARPGEARPRLVVGFAAETQDLERSALAKRVRKGCDWIVANDVGAHTGTMGGESNAVLLVTAQGTESWERMPKREVARRLALRIAAALAAALPRR
jgi:phosphopantothenoylcysteine decarboxylase/phosphopantothenate--cysteine ligase